MSLTTRVSAFFLIALAVVLASFSGALYLLARTYLVRQLDERLQLSLDTLEAAVDIEPGGLEWEPADRKMELGVDAGINAVRWMVRDEGGLPVDGSLNSRHSLFPSDWSPARTHPDRPDATIFGTVPGWRLACRRLQLGDLLRQGRGHPDDEPGYEVQYQTLVLLVGLAPSPVEASLSRLALTLVLLSSVVWATAAVTGRWLCTRALAPVSRMARAAAAMTAEDLGTRLPTLDTGDELDELGRAYNEMLDRLHDSFGQLRDAYEQQRQFAGNASHQLRTPLTALLGQVQVARRRDRSPEEYRRVLDLVQEEGARLRQIVETLLYLAQPATGRLPTETVDLGDWIVDHLRRWSGHPRAGDLRAEIAHGPPLEACVNAHLFAQLLDNLLENAVKYSPPGSPIVVRARREGQETAISVEDRGCGLEAEDIGRVFEPFYRAENARRVSREGLGLGLAVARRIASTFGGTLGVNSQPEAGCRFTLRLPVISRIGVVKELDPGDGKVAVTGDHPPHRRIQQDGRGTIPDA